MKIKSIAPWFGGKRMLAPRIVEALGPHVQYFEPFCGGLSVLFGKPPSRHETVNDFHSDVANLARCLADREYGFRLWERCNRTLCSEALLNDAANELANPMAVGTLCDADRAYWFLVASWLNRNGTAGTQQNTASLAVRWTPNGGSPAKRWRSVCDSMPAWHERLRNVVILSRDAFAVIEAIPDRADTVIYADPPYMRETRSARNGGRGTSGSAVYEFDFADDDHDQLAKVLRTFERTRVVVSYYDCERVRALYDGWRVIECPTHKQLSAAGCRDSKSDSVASEVLLVNRPGTAGLFWLDRIENGPR